jgi:hypothetical protein
MQSADDDVPPSAMPPRHPAGGGGGGGGPQHPAGGGGGGPQLAALLQTQAEILRQLTAMEQGSPQGPPPQQGPPRGRQDGPPPGRQGPPPGRQRPAPPRMPPGGGGGGGPDGPPPPHHRHHRHRRPPPPSQGGPPQGGPPSGPPPDGGGRDASNIARTLGDVANAAAATAQAVPQIAAAFHGGTGGVVVANPVWASLATVLGEVSSGFRATGSVAPEQETFLRVVEHLAQVVSALAINPSDPSLLAEYEEMSAFLSAHPDSQALSAFIATHPAIVPVIAASAPPGAAAGAALELVGPSIHRYRASGEMADSVEQTLSDVGNAASRMPSVVPQLPTGFSTGSAALAAAAVFGFVVPLMGGFALGSLYRGWLDSYVSRATEKVRAACAVAGIPAHAPVPVNPMWATLAKVLGEVSSGFRLTGVPPEKETFLRVVEHLGDVVNGLALHPNDPSLLAEYQELSVFLAAHPDSRALAEFIGTHPAIVPVIAPVLG